MTYRYGVRNAFRPTALAPKPYAWTSAPAYNRADVPTALMGDTNVTQEVLRQQFAYEWFQSGDLGGWSPSALSNPPFVSGAAGRLHPSLAMTKGGQGPSGTGGSSPARILRGYIRRAQREVGKGMSDARLYFMYNPEVISRDYVSYLEQGALDPFNTVYQSGNAIAPPSILDFSFELFFDRQEEATDENHPGVYVDYQFFDMVVRNVFPDPASAPANTIPDNGVMMVNPRDITVVFSPQMTIQGRPLNARVTFEKFTHRMTPTRMRIQLTMRAVYLGPIREMTEYKAEEFPPEASIPFDEYQNRTSFLSVQELDINLAAAIMSAVTGAIVGAVGQAVYNAQSGLASAAGGNMRAQALNWATANIQEGVTKYNDNNPARYNLPVSADCSGLVVSAYKAIGQAEPIFGSGYPGTKEIINRWEANGYKNVQKVPADQLQYGDIIIKRGHVRFFHSYREGGIKCVEAASYTATPQVGLRNASAVSSPYFAVRPMPVGGDMNYNANARPNQGTVQYAV